MNHSRRDFIKTTGIFCGAVASDLSGTLGSSGAGLPPVNRRELAELALARSKKLGCSYCDIRVNKYRHESIFTREQRVLDVSRTHHYGFGIRILYRGAWGFAASHVVTPDSIRNATDQAFDIARANSRYQLKPVKIVGAEKVEARWRSAFEKDPFEVPVDKKVEFLLKINERAMQVKGVSFITSVLFFQNEDKFFASTDGSVTEQYIIRTLPGFEVTAVDQSGGDFQTRSNLSGPKTIGYEYLDQAMWLEDARKAGEEAVTKLTAKPVEPGKYDLVLHPSHLWLTIHESVGHSTELDRALLWEADFAGTSFITPDQTGKLEFGSKICNFYADRTQPHGLATVGYDDEGVKAQRWPLVKDGIFVDWQTTRDLAPLIGRSQSYGCLHSDSWGSVPFPRMPNVSLEPANGAFWEIKKGKINGMLRDVAYQSRTTDFWHACDGLGGRGTYELNGASNDGKGQPEQANAVSHGCPVTRFRQINVLNTAASKKA